MRMNRLFYSNSWEKSNSPAATKPDDCAQLGAVTHDSECCLYMQVQVHALSDYWQIPDSQRADNDAQFRLH